jgi:hypothetical protein
MPSFKVAHIREQGQNMLLFPLDSSFGNKTSSDQNAILNELEDRAHAAGLAGSAAIFWQHGGHGHFMGPRPWHPFLRGLSYNAVVRSLNKTISW